MLGRSQRAKRCPQFFGWPMFLAARELQVIKFSKRRKVTQAVLFPVPAPCQPKNIPYRLYGFLLRRCSFRQLCIYNTPCEARCRRSSTPPCLAIIDLHNRYIFFHYSTAVSYPKYDMTPRFLCCVWVCS